MLLDRLNLLAKNNPNDCAVVAGEERLTYAELEGGARRVARALLARGLSRGSMIAVYGRRTATAMVQLIGIMKAGAAYTVVEDDGHHAENYGRLAAIEPSLVLCDEEHLAALQERGIPASSGDDTVRIEGDSSLPVVEADQTAYVLFTSGSTGKPKGVAVSHGNIAHYTVSVIARLDIEPGMRYAHVSTLAADLGNTSLFLSLWTGGCLHVVDIQTRKDPAALRAYLVTNEIQFVKITPSHWNAIFAGMRSSTERLRLDYLVLGGEALPLKLAREILQSGVVRVLVNHYGPTETTVGVTCYPIYGLEQLDALSTDSVPIGLPLGHTILRVRTAEGTFHKRGVRGELYIGGPSVAIGYVGDQAGTERSFVSLSAMEGTS